MVPCSGRRRVRRARAKRQRGRHARRLVQGAVAGHPQGRQRPGSCCTVIRVVKVVRKESTSWCGPEPRRHRGLRRRSPDAAREEIAAVAARVGARWLYASPNTFRPSVSFRQLPVLVNPDGSLGARSDKVRRVRGGTALRGSSITSPSPTSCPRRGRGRVPPLSTHRSACSRVISWDISAPRSRCDGHGSDVAQPTNGASYRAPSCDPQVASSDCAREDNGWGLSVATGFPAVVPPRVTSWPDRMWLTTSDRGTSDSPGSPVPATRRQARLRARVGMLLFARSNVEKVAQSSIHTVVGPSLTSSTSITARKRPV